MPEIKRVNRYTIEVDGRRVSANEDQERRIRAMDPESLDRFMTIMGYPKPAPEGGEDRG